MAITEPDVDITKLHHRITDLEILVKRLSDFVGEDVMDYDDETLAHTVLTLVDNNVIIHTRLSVDIPFHFDGEAEDMHEARAAVAKAKGQ